MNANAILIVLLGGLPAITALAQHRHDESAAAEPAEPVEHQQHAPPATPEPASHEDHALPGTPEPASHEPPAPPAALSGPTHAADALFGAEQMAAARAQLRREEGGLRTGTAFADRFETGIDDREESYLWDIQGWYGGDIQKLWWKTEGEGELGDNAEDAELQVLYSHAVTPFFDLQAGVRHDFRPSPQRSHAVIGIQGLLPYVFEIDAAAFLSEHGDWSGRFEAEYDFRIRQRLVLQPRIELDFAARAVPELGIGSGVGSVEGGLRLRYEIRRELAPYLGVVWERKLGDSADFARRAGAEPRDWQVVLGVRAWF